MWGCVGWECGTGAAWVGDEVWGCDVCQEGHVGCARGILPLLTFNDLHNALSHSSVINHNWLHL